MAAAAKKQINVSSYHCILVSMYMNDQEGDLLFGKFMEKFILPFLKIMHT